LLAFVCWSCTHDSGTEKYQSKRDNAVNVREKLKEISIEYPPINSIAILYLMDNYLIIEDLRSWDKIIHLFDRNTFLHVVSAVSRGQGPNEIANAGPVGIDNISHKFYVSDFGKYKIFSYDLDSVLTVPSYIPTVKMTMNEGKFPERYEYISDTLCIGQFIVPVGVSDYRPVIARWNMNTGEVVPMKYEYPAIEKKRTSFAASPELGIYVECYSHHDLMTICSLDGDLKYNICGPNWNSRKSNKMDYYGKAVFCGNKLFVLYTGGNSFVDHGKGMESNWPTKFLVFDMNGDYIRTLETGYRIVDFCYDSESNRIIMSMNDEIQFAYLELDGLLE
jgi:hypothetical protein